MARWEQYGDYPKESVKWMKPAHNPTGLLVNEIIKEVRKLGLCAKKKA